MSSKFKGLLDAARGREPEPEPEPLAPLKEKGRLAGKRRGREPEHIPEPPDPPKKKGRPPGKRSHPDYEQVTAYIRRDTYRAVKINLLQQGEDRESKELVEELLTECLSTQKSKH